MRIYRFKPDGDRFPYVFAVSKKTLDRFHALEARHAKNWTAPNMRWGGGMGETDFPDFLVGVPVVSDRALGVMRPFFRNVDELPLRVPKGTYWALYVRDIIDALDREASTIDWFDDENVSVIRNYVFDPSRLGDIHLFQIPEYQTAAVYLSGKLWDAIQEADLVGLSSDSLVWSDER